MKKTVLANVGGFTPMIDSITQAHDVFTSAVFGRVWRYCKMKDGVCSAKLDTIADELHISRATVIRHLEILCKEGYLVDLTPNYRNQPHKYADTGKAGIVIDIRVTNPSDETESGVSERYTAESESDSAPYQKDTATVSERYLKIEEKEEQESDEENLSSEDEPEPVDPSVTPEYLTAFTAAMMDLRDRTNVHARDRLDDLSLQSVNGTWRVQVPRTNLSWLRSNYIDGSLNRILALYVGQPVAVEFVIGGAK